MQGSSLSKVTITLMICVALFFDFIQFLLDLFHIIPVVGNAFAAIATALLSVVAFMVFWFWFAIHDVKFNTTKRFFSMGGGFLIELIPILNALPAWTLAVILVITTTKVPQIAQLAAAAKGKPGSIATTAAKNAGSTTTTRSVTNAATPRTNQNGFDKRPNNKNNTRNFDGIRPIT